MRVGTAPKPILPTREVEGRRTPVTGSEIRSAIERSLERLDGKRPSSKLVDVLTAQACLETASGTQMHNFNFGGIKGSGTDGTAVLRTKEVVGGNTVAVRDGFRAYRSLDEGALDFVKTLRARFQGAMDPAANGDVVGFAHALKRSGYFTASETDYARGLKRLIGEATPTTIAEAPSVAKASLVSSRTLARFEDALDADRIAFLPSPRRAPATEEEDD